jgi:hypothetical protein
MEKATTSAWNRAFLVIELACIPLVIWWIPYAHLPASGWAVAFIAGAAAAMSVHDGMRGWQKGIWLLIIGAFLITELRAISKDRADEQHQAMHDRQAQDAAFAGVRDTQNANFAATANGLKVAISGIETTLNTATTTLKQTTPHAYFGEPHEDDGKAVIGSGTSFLYNVNFINTGNETAKKFRIYSKIYTGKPDDVATQELLHSQFEKDWVTGTVNRVVEIPPNSPQFASFTSIIFSESEATQIQASTLTIYTFTRIAYSDSGGNWYSDNCSALQVPLQVGGLPGHPCDAKYNDKRYKPKQR